MKTALRPADKQSWLNTLWDALSSYRDDCIPEGAEKRYDEEWSEICRAMAWITEALGLPRDPDDPAPAPSENAAPPLPAANAAEILANALKMTIICNVEALTEVWDKSNDGFISLIDMAEQALEDAGCELGEHDYEDTDAQMLEALYPEARAPARSST